jgi:hypothetical protein
MLDQNLVACANLVPTMISYYKWKGVNHREGETGVLFKTDASLLSTAMKDSANFTPIRNRPSWGGGVMPPRPVRSLGWGIGGMNSIAFLAALAATIAPSDGPPAQCPSMGPTRDQAEVDPHRRTRLVRWQKDHRQAQLCHFMSR